MTMPTWLTNFLRTVRYLCGHEIKVTQTYVGDRLVRETVEHEPLVLKGKEERRE